MSIDIITWLQSAAQCPGKLYGLIEQEKRYSEHELVKVLENENAKFYWDRITQTGKSVEANRADIILRDKTEKKMNLIDIAIPSTNNQERTIKTKEEKYADLAVESCRS